MVLGHFEVAEELVKGRLVFRARVGSMVAKCHDGVGDVRVSAQHRIYKGSEGTLVGFDINFGGRKFG
jgi:hypothetical protein